MKKILKYDWDAIAGIIAAVAAILMHFLHLVDADILLMIAVVLIALLFLRDLRRERHGEHLDACLQRTLDDVVLDLEVFVDEVCAIGVVGQNAANPGCRKEDIGWLLDLQKIANSALI